MARYYLRQMHIVDPEFAGPLVRATALAGKDILDPRVVQELADTWKYEPAKAVELYFANWRAVMPCLHQEQPKAFRSRLAPPKATSWRRSMTICLKSSGCPMPMASNAHRSDRSC